MEMTMTLLRRPAKATRKWKRLLALNTGALLAVIVAGSVQATCYGGGNEGAWRDDAHTSSSKGVRARFDHRSATPLSSVTAIVHPMQVDGWGSSDFIGWGTVKGVGVPGTSCGDNFTNNWDVYVDGYSFGVYFCNQTWGSVANTAQVCG